jgi:P27 family predicted phage terminase small subunit
MRRLPTSLKVLRGTLKKSRQNVNEPQPERFLPPCPPYLQDEARRHWYKLSKKLYRLGLLTEIDDDALGLYCQCWARWVKAEQKLAEEGLTTKAQSGYAQPSPWLSIANKALEQVCVLGAEFGLSPVSRSKVGGTAALPTTPNKLSRYLEESKKEERFFGST